VHSAYIHFDCRRLGDGARGNRPFDLNDKPAGNNELSSLDRTHYTPISYTTHVGYYNDSIIISVFGIVPIQYVSEISIMNAEPVCYTKCSGHEYLCTPNVLYIDILLPFPVVKIAFFGISALCTKTRLAKRTSC